MKAERRTIIVREIEHWRRSKLLPDQYCDFLLNLYADPLVAPKSEQPTHLFGKAAKTISQATGKQWFLTFGIFTLISFVVLYFNVFHPLLQIVLIIGFSGILIWQGQRVAKTNEGYGILSIGSGHLAFLLGSLYFISYHGYNDWYYIAGIIALCGIIWIIYGVRRLYSFIHLCGWLALLLAYALMLYQLTDGQKWYQIQLYWIPLSILFGWLSWFVHRYTKPAAAVLLITSIVTWLLPELFQIVFIGHTPFFEIQLLIKIVLGGLILFILRKQWMVWVS